MFIAIRILFISAPLGAQCVMPLLTELQTVLECIRAINIARLTALNAGAEAIRYPSSSTLIYLSVGSLTQTPPSPHSTTTRPASLVSSTLDRFRSIQRRKGEQDLSGIDLASLIRNAIGTFPDP